MKWKPISVCLFWLSCLSACSAIPRTKDYRQVSSELMPGEGSAPSSALSKEPSCEELRAMWRFSKRQSRAAEITNEIPTYKDPFAYNVWEEYARPRSAGGRSKMRKPPVYGRVLHRPDNSPDRNRAFEEVTRDLGTGRHHLTALPRRKTSFRLGGGASAFLPPTQVGSFQHLKELIRTERARELQEQRVSEEADRTQYGRRVQVAEAPVHPRPVLAFPDMLGPPAPPYLEELLAPSPNPSFKYKQSLPQPDTIISGTGGSEWSW